MRKVIAIGEAIHMSIEKKLRSKPVRRAPVSPLAVELRVETAQREQGDFGLPKPKTPTFTPGLDVTHDEMVNQFLAADAEMQLRYPCGSLTGFGIMEEIEQERLAGKLKPFVEGEPIGCIKNWPRDPAPALKSEKDLYDERQKCMLELRRKNDETMDSILVR